MIRGHPITAPAVFDAVDALLRHFSVEPARSLLQREDAGRLRHRVYCEEFAYEAPSATGIETDVHDEYSLHLLLRHRRSGACVGCVRLIFAFDGAPLALEQHCISSVYPIYADALNGPRASICEFSRLAVAPEFRGMRNTDSGSALLHSGDRSARGDRSADERHCMPLVTTATFLAAFAAAELCGRYKVFGMMEASLPRLLRRSGICVQRAGDFMDYHGRRAAHFITVDDAVDGMSPAVAMLYTEIRARLAEELPSPVTASRSFREHALAI